MIGIESNIPAVIQARRFIVNMLCCGRIRFIEIKDVDIKGVW